MSVAIKFASDVTVEHIEDVLDNLSGEIVEVQTKCEQLSTAGEIQYVMNGELVLWSGTITNRIPLVEIEALVIL